jgi:hypothetical protein
MSEIGYIRAPQHDKRFARGDDYAGDAWRNAETGEIKMVAVGHSPANCKRCNDTGWLDPIEGIDGSYITFRPCECDAGDRVFRLS